MTDTPRFSLRLRQCVLRCYEVGLYAVLIGMAVAVVLPPAAGDEDDAAYCGKAQSSAAVIVR